jgi:PAS domain-containing protein
MVLEFRSMCSRRKWRPAISLENTRLYRDLEVSEAKIRRLVDANIIGIHIWNLEGEIIDGNEAFLRMLGYNRADLVSGRMRRTELTLAEWREPEERALARSQLLESFSHIMDFPECLRLVR